MVRWALPVMPTVDDPMPDLVRGLRSPSADVRSRAARALGRLGSLARDAMPLLASVVHDPEPAVRESAAQALGLMGPGALPHLVGMLRHPDKYVRRNAIWSLGKLGPAALGELHALTLALQDADPRVASGAAQALGSLGADAAAAVPGLTEAMRGTNIVLCRLAAKALSQIGRPALPALLSHLRHRDPFVRGEAALALGWIGPPAAVAVPDLIECLRSTATPPPGRHPPRPADARRGQPRLRRPVPWPHRPRRRDRPCPRSGTPSATPANPSARPPSRPSARSTPRRREWLAVALNPPLTLTGGRLHWSLLGSAIPESACARARDDPSRLPPLSRVLQATCRVRQQKRDLQAVRRDIHR